MSTQEQEPVITGGCFCGGARYEVRGKPVLSAYCHCTLCQRFNAAAFIHTIHFPASSFKWTTAEDNLQTYVVPTKPWKTRFRCKNCGVAVAGHNGRRDKRSIWGGQLDRETEGGRIKNWDIVKPSAHIFYETRMLDVNDGLSKWAGYEGDSERLG
ncbi:hypothetical protein CC1G_13744 [Coprinopsis cinerea okayama7|uniref:CENP-V/GFA domain-containing protein n=1 Tax=Coprinopsis cinerea (strain Okayama-7 / 130 / ATCC MYA-4618 / FGSC 9003) TaxID=240176 RepID=D6RJR7_COPC7|nr:hypothetical protein CC1G_13744 [Coprinopsis cinerea okayama7\|eukprot:XP_002912212.1 hypothetical protein CC1G_13744 [Coprinopsis cinerea okayama7\